MERISEGIIWVHTLLCVVAMWGGGQVLFGSKGGGLHRLRGKRYVMTMIGANGTALLLNMEKWLNIFHWMAIITLASVLLAYIAARLGPFWGWLQLHLSAMLFSYYMLWGGFINEFFLHVPALRDLPPAERGAFIGIAQTVLMLVTLGIVGFFLWQSRRKASFRCREAMGAKTTKVAAS